MFISSLLICDKKVGWSLISYLLLVKKYSHMCFLYYLLQRIEKSFPVSKRTWKAHRSLHHWLFIYSNFDILCFDENMFSMRGKTILFPSLQASCFPNILPVQLKKGGKKNLPLSTKYVTLSHSFGLSYEPCTINSNKIPYLEGKIILLNN